MTSTIGIIGVGEIARAIVTGLLGKPAPGDAPLIYLSPRNLAIAQHLAERHSNVRACSSNQAVVDSARIVLLTVRPADLDDALENLRVPDDRIIVSAVAGASTVRLRRKLHTQATIVRAIPLPAVQRRLGITAIYPPHPEVAQLFGPLGGTLSVDDAETFDAVQASTATISTHLRLLEASATWLTKHGVPTADAENYVRDLFVGVSAGLADGGLTLSDLVAAHETAEGINEHLARTWFTTTNSRALSGALDETYTRLVRDR